MEYGYQKVLEVQRRCEITFEEADKALKAEKGDVDKACAFAMRKKKKDNSWTKIVWEALKNFITYRMRISKNGSVKFEIPLGIVLGISAFIGMFSYYTSRMLGLLYFCIFVVTVATGHSLEFVPAEKKAETSIEKVETQEISEEEVYEKSADQEVEPEDDGYNLIEIE